MNDITIARNSVPSYYSDILQEREALYHYYYWAAERLAMTPFGTESYANERYASAGAMNLEE